MENITLWQGDCLDLMGKIEDKSIDCIICDLPYGTTACKWDTIIPFDKLWEQYGRVIKDNGAIVLFGSEPFSSELRLSNKELYRYDWIWEKPYKTLYPRASYRPLLGHENICIFYKKQPTYNPQGVIPCNKEVRQKLTTLKDSVYLNNNFKDVEVYKKKYTNYPSTILKIGKHINTKGRKHLHPTQKDLDLIEYLVRTYSNEGDLILDNCMGSGTTGVACVNTNRRFVGIEKEEEFFNIAKDRIEGVIKNKSENVEINH